MSFVLAGLYFGYPRCCITDFVARFDERRRLGKRDVVPNEAWVGTGFRPCPTCRPRCITPEKFEAFVAERITPHRICETPFPEGDVP